MKLLSPNNGIILSLLSTLSTAQHVTVPPNCISGFTAGTDTVLYTIPYTYAQTLSIIGSYQNLTWSGNPPDTVSLNGSDNTVGTARTYMTAGAEVIETLLIYDSPPDGPYYEVHNLAQLTVPAFDNVTLYAAYDGTTVVSVCDGKATMFNFTTHFCATNLTDGTAAFHAVHTADAMGAAMLLGNQNFTSCDAITGSGNASATATTSSGQPVATFAGGAAVPASRTRVWVVGAVFVGAAAWLVL